MSKDLPYSMTSCPDLAVVGPLDFELPKGIGQMPFIYLDAGLKHRSEVKKSNLESASFAIGDNDSFEGDSNLFDVLLEQKKDESDFSAAMKLLSLNQSDLERIHLFGLLGQRLDHQLALFGDLLRNLNFQDSLLVYFYDGQKSLDSSMPKMILFSENFETNLFGTFSLMSFQENSVSIEGDIEYPLSNHVLEPLTSRGLSNEARGKVKITSTAPLLLIIPETT